jgi:hypothetical protein
MPRALQAMEIVAAVAGDGASPAVIASEIRNFFMAVPLRVVSKGSFDGRRVVNPGNCRSGNWSCHADTNQSAAV